MGLWLTLDLTRVTHSCKNMPMMSTKQRAEVIGNKIRSARKRRGISQVGLAQLLAERYGTEAERERRTLVNNETGKYAPRLHRLQAIAEALETPLDYFAVEEGGDGDGEPVPFREAV